jgi:predicted DCC family thiol-disulfide oxidoreductase YuxK
MKHPWAAFGPPTVVLQEPTGANVAGVPATPVLYDDECRFCRTVLALLLAWDRERRLRPVALQSEEAERLLPGVDRADRLKSMHVVPVAAAPASGGAAFSPLFGELPGGGALARLASRFPQAAEAGYAAVADNRGRLSKLVPRAVSDRADALVRRREREETLARPGVPEPDGP